MVILHPMPQYITFRNRTRSLYGAYSPQHGHFHLGFMVRPLYQFAPLSHEFVVTFYLPCDPACSRAKPEVFKQFAVQSRVLPLTVSTVSYFRVHCIGLLSLVFGGIYGCAKHEWWVKYMSPFGAMVIRASAWVAGFWQCEHLGSITSSSR